MLLKASNQQYRINNINTKLPVNKELRERGLEYPTKM